MDRHQTRILYIVLGLFAVTSAVLVWSFVHRYLNTFQAGTRPEFVESTVKPKQPPARPDDPARGSSNPQAITITEFADFTCVYCRATERELVRALNEFPDVRHVWRDMPVASDSPDAVLASVAGRCAKDQGRFWEMHELLLSMPRINVETVRDAARDVGIDVGSFSTCLASPKKASDIQADIQIALDHDLASAPTFFIGNQVLTGYQTAADFRWAIIRAKWSQ